VKEKLNWKKLLFLTAAAFFAPATAQVAQGLPVEGHAVVTAGVASVVTMLYALFSNPRTLK